MEKIKLRKNTFLEHCRALPHATEDIKWKKDLVFSVGQKMFAVFNLDDVTQFSFKATPAMFGTLTAIAGIVPAPYVARYNWVLVTNSKALPQKMLKGLLTESYQMVAAGLPAKVRKKLAMDIKQNKSRRSAATKQLKTKISGSRKRNSH